MKKLFIILFASVMILSNINAMEELEHPKNSNAMEEEKPENSKILPLKILANVKVLDNHPELDVYPLIRQINGENYFNIRQAIKEQLQGIPIEIHPQLIYSAINKHSSKNNQKYLKKTLQDMPQCFNRSNETIDNLFSQLVNQLLIVRATRQSQNLGQIKAARKLLEGNKDRWLDPLDFKEEQQYCWDKECTLWDASFRGKARNASYYSIFFINAGLGFIMYTPIHFSMQFLFDKNMNLGKHEFIGKSLLGLISGFLLDRLLDKYFEPLVCKFYTNLIKKIKKVHHKDLEFNYFGSYAYYLLTASRLSGVGLGLFFFNK